MPRILRDPPPSTRQADEPTSGVDARRETLGVGPVTQPVVDDFTAVDGARPASRSGGPVEGSTSTQVAGLTIRGLDLGSAESGEMVVSLPLRKGTFLVPTHHADAKTRVQQEGSVEVRLEFRKDAQGTPRMTRIRLELEPKVTVLNPASSLQPAQGPLADVWNWIQDVLGDIHLNALQIGEDGVVSVEGVVDRPAPMSDQDLNQAIPPGTFPVFDMRLSSIAAGKFVAPSSPSENAAPSPAPPKGKKSPTLEALLQSMGAMTGAGTFSLRLQSAETTLTANLKGLHISSERARVEVSLDGKVRLDPSGELFLEIPDDEDREVLSGLGTMNLAGRGTARFGDQGLDATFQLQTQTNLDGVTGYLVREPSRRAPVTIRGADNVIVANTTVRVDPEGVTLENGDARVQVRADLPDGTLVNVEGNQVRLVDGAATTEGNFRFQLRDGQLAVNDGAVELVLSGQDAELVRDGARLRLGAGASVRIHGQQLSLDPQTTHPTGRGTIALEYQGQTTGAVGALDYELERDGTVVLRPRSTQARELIIPLGDLQGKRPFIVDPLGPGAGPIGSAAFQQRITELTGAPVTTDNQVTLLPQGHDSHRARLELIRRARSSIHLQTFIFRADETGQQTADALIEAARRGVEVKVIVDGLGNADSSDDLVNEHPLYAKLKAGGVAIEIHGDPREHAIGELMRELMNNPDLPTVEDPRALLTDPGRAAELIQELAKVALGTRNAPTGTRERLAAIFAKSSAGQGEQAATISAERLASLAAGDPLTMRELIVALRHVAELNYRWHEKYLEVDGTAAIVGGMNIADEYLLGGSGRPWTSREGPKDAWRDADVLLRGGSVAQVRAAFGRNWKHLTGEEVPAAEPGPATPGKAVQLIQHHPRLDGAQPITNTYIEAIKALQPGQRAYLANAYFLPTGSLDALKTALIEAARRGVDVRILTNSDTSTDMPALNWAAVYPLEELIAGGVRVFERTAPSALHTKAAAFGGQLAVVGSFNTDNRSASLNSEAIAAIYDPQTAGQVEQMIQADMAPEVARELDLPTVQARIRAAGPKNQVAALFADLM